MREEKEYEEKNVRIMMVDNNDYKDDNDYDNDRSSCELL